ncbi:hypothetical protein BCR44DRAFT_1463613 [Catenaria anguillulae PL171]|uniref:Tc1-like transposase DDE domain-containing protein n=1 Tax=Catenaria anguillulae PL171 TaxID=765915 RepID=A0A1Y2HBD2_9FUNG|nr:hypothetical protein BCR44DRAFT_1463613 [Catenaria anguillulae PL171]
MSIGASTLWSILQNEFKMTLKKLERRARHVRDSNILRFVRKLASIKQCKTNMIFLDEVSFNNRGMLHRAGYGPKGKPLIFRDLIASLVPEALRTFIPMLPTERTLAKEWLKMVQTSGLAAWEPDVIIIKGKKYSVEDMDVSVEATETLNETIHII